MARRYITRFAGVVVGAGALFGLQLVGAGVAGASGSDDGSECGYAADIVTATDLTIDRTSIAPGQTTQAHVTVTSGAGVPPGSVDFQVDDREASTVALTAGSAAFTIPADLVPGTYTVTATYLAPVCWLPSSDAATLHVVPPTQPQPEPAAVLPLPATGAGGAVTGAALTGLVLLGAGGTILLVRRRRRTT